MGIGKDIKKPIVFYIYGYDCYTSELMGFYLARDEVPGPIVKDEYNLIKKIENVMNRKADEKYEAFHKKYNPLDDGRASERLIKCLIQ